MAVQFRDYYETLGVSKTATEDEIRSAFRKLARKYHPDVAKDKKAAEEKFKQINEAYEVLSDPEKRKKYDQLGADWNQPGGFQPPPQWSGQPGGVRYYQWGGGDGGIEFEFGGTGFSDFFEAFFGGGRGRSAFGGFGGQAATAERGARRQKRRPVRARASGAAPRFSCRRQRSDSRGKNCSEGGGPRHGTEGADAGGQRAAKGAARDPGRPTVPIARARFAERVRKTGRSL